MSRLRYPLKRQLQDPVDEAAIHRIARAINSHPRQDKRRLVILPVAAAAIVVAVAIASFLRVDRDAGPLALADGREFVAVDASGSTRVIDLSDGSSIRLSPGSHLAPLNNSETTFSAILIQGRAEFNVQPGGPREWVIECGLATVEVVGTAFSCERAPGSLRVSVDRGVVLVRGEHVPDRAHRLAAGETLDIAEHAPQRPSATTDRHIGSAPRGSTSPSDADAGTETQRVASSATHIAATKTWRDLARSGRNEEAFKALGPEGVRSETRKLGVSDLLALADVARLSGHPAEAVLPFERVLAEFSSDPQAPLAAFALGRLHLDSLGRPQAAISALQRALALGVPHGLREDVRARLVEAYARSGDSVGAERAAEAYSKEFPNGRYTRAVSRWRRAR